MTTQMGGDEWSFAEIKGFVSKLKKGRERFEKLNLKYEW